MYTSNKNHGCQFFQNFIPNPTIGIVIKRCAWQLRAIFRSWRKPIQVGSNVFAEYYKSRVNEIMKTSCGSNGWPPCSSILWPKDYATGGSGEGVLEDIACRQTGEINLCSFFRWLYYSFLNRTEYETPVSPFVYVTQGIFQHYFQAHCKKCRWFVHRSWFYQPFIRWLDTGYGKFRNRPKNKRKGMLWHKQINLQVNLEQVVCMK
jgi:hypothetical protein